MSTKTFAVIVSTLATLLIICGAAGMLVCLIFLFSSHTQDILGAGLGFVAGAILLGSGTIALAVISARPSSDPSEIRSAQR